MTYEPVIADPIKELCRGIEHLYTVLDAGLLIAGLGKMTPAKREALMRLASALEELILSLREIQTFHREEMP